MRSEEGWHWKAINPSWISSPGGWCMIVGAVISILTTCSMPFAEHIFSGNWRD